jgi:hypothetical protein
MIHQPLHVREAHAPASAFVMRREHDGTHATDTAVLVLCVIEVGAAESHGQRLGEITRSQCVRSMIDASSRCLFVAEADKAWAKHRGNLHGEPNAARAQSRSRIRFTMHEHFGSVSWRATVAMLALCPCAHGV